MKTYVINLASRTDRWYQVLAECNRMGLTVEHFNACTDESPHIAFNRSQYEVIKRGYDSGEDCFLVLEDDAVFDGQWSEVEEAMQDLPPDWDALYLGANICTDWFRKPERVTERLCRLRDCWQSHAIIWSRKGAQTVLERFNVEGEGWYIFDEQMRQKLFPDGNTYLMSPMIAYQRPGKSDIWERETDYTGAHIQGNRILQMI